MAQLCLRIQNLYSADVENNSSLLLEMAKESFHKDWAMALSYLLTVKDIQRVASFFDEIISIYLLLVIIIAILTTIYIDNTSDTLVIEQLLSFASYYFALLVYVHFHKDSMCYAFHSL